MALFHHSGSAHPDVNGKQYLISEGGEDLTNTCIKRIFVHSGQITCQVLLFVIAGFCWFVASVAKEKEMAFSEDVWKFLFVFPYGNGLVIRRFSKVK